MNLRARLSKLESIDPSGLHIVILYDGEAPPVSCNGLTVIVRKPGRRP